MPLTFQAQRYEMRINQDPEYCGPLHYLRRKQDVGAGSLCILRVRICMNLTILRPADLQLRRELLDGGRAWRPCRVRLGCAITASRRQAGCDEVHLHNLGESFTLLPEFSARRLFLLRIVTGCTKSSSFQCLLSHYIAREPPFRNTSKYRQSKIPSTSTGGT